jgi:SAM-dependent methyltransferase
MRGCKVLEVGCGVDKWNRIRLAGNAEWIGMDASPRRPRVVGGLVTDIPFESGTFDWVIGFGTIEHWHEHGSSVVDSMKEIKRVLKRGGRMLLSVPFHAHGHQKFLLGHVWLVRQEIMSARWMRVEFEDWRRDHRPLPPDYYYRQMRNWGRRTRLELAGFDESCWTMEVLATKGVR